MIFSAMLFLLNSKNHFFLFNKKTIPTCIVLKFFVFHLLFDCIEKIFFVSI